MKKKRLIPIIILIAVVCIFSVYKYNEFQHFGKYVKAANKCVEEEKYNEAIQLYNKALINKNDYSIRASIEKIKKLITSKQFYLKGKQQFDQKQYSNAIEDLKKVWSEDKKRYLTSQTDIIESYYNLGDMDSADKYVNSIKNSLKESEASRVMQKLYARQGDFNFNKDNEKAVDFYQKAWKYGYDANNSDNYANAMYSVADAVCDSQFNTGDIATTRYLSNFDGNDLYDNVMITTKPVGSGGYSECYIYKITGRNYTNIFKSSDFSGYVNPVLNNKYYNSKLMDNFKIMFYSSYSSKKYLVDISSRESPSISNFSIQNSQGPDWKPVDTDNDGIDELEMNVYLDGTSHGDYVTDANTYFKYDASKKSWNFKDYSIENPSKKYPVSKLDDNFKPDFKVNSSEQAVDIFKTKVENSDNLKFESEYIISKGEDVPAGIAGKAAYGDFSSENTGGASISYYVIKSTGQVYECDTTTDYDMNGQSQYEWTLMK